MSQSVIDAIKVKLYDLNDDMKAALSELNPVSYTHLTLPTNREV